MGPEKKQHPPPKKKVQDKEIEDLINCAPMFLFFYSIKLKAFCVTQNETPKMAKNFLLYSQVVTLFCGTRPR